MSVKLSELLPGEEAVVLKIEGKSADTRRLREMGIRKGASVLMKRDAPLGDPMEIRVMHTNISLRKSEAETVIIEKKKAQTDSRVRRVALVGNPNCGKTTLFNLLTGARQHVGNWPGVTVEKKTGRFSYQGTEIELVDLPGTYSMSPNTIEEKIVRDFLLFEKPDLVLNVIDGTALERSLYLTAQVIDTGVPFIVALNMIDEVRAKNVRIDHEKMEELLKTRVVPIAAKKEEGIVPLIRILAGETPERPRKPVRVNYGDDVEQAVDDLVCALGCPSGGLSARWTALELLQNASGLPEPVKNGFTDPQVWQPLLDRHLKKLAAVYGEDLSVNMEDRRYGFVQGVVHECVSVETKSKKPEKRRDLTEAIDAILLNRFVSFPVFALILWATFQLTFSVGGFLSGYLSSGIGLLNAAVHTAMPEGILKDLVTEGIITGVGGILVFFPQIMILFFIIALLEDSGYMARIAFIMDRLMHFLGIHGKSFISMFMGLGCNVPGILAARTLENEDDRIVTVLINPFMSCSARLPIYVMITGIFFQRWAGTVIFLLYLTGILVAILTAKLLKTFFFRGKSAPFVMELPPYRTPSGKSLLIHMWERASLFLRKMGSIILVGSVIIWALGYFPRTVNFSDGTNLLGRKVQTTADPAERERLARSWEREKSREQIENSYIGKIGKTVEPFFRPLGFGWKEGVALITGVVGKEIVVSTLSVLYGEKNGGPAMDKPGQGDNGMRPSSALAFLIFVLLYIPCLASIAAVRKETRSVKWMLFSVFYGIGVGYVLGTLVNLAGKFLFRF